MSGGEGGEVWGNMGSPADYWFICQMKGVQVVTAQFVVFNCVDPFP